MLNCGGFKFNGLILCSGTVNTIVDFADHLEIERLDEVLDFLDFSCKLFDGVMTDWNKITNAIKILHDRFDLIDPGTWQFLFTWLPQHKHCGACLSLIFNDQLLDEQPKEEELILPKKSEPKVSSAPINNKNENTTNKKKYVSVERQIKDAIRSSGPLTLEELLAQVKTTDEIQAQRILDRFKQKGRVSITDDGKYELSA